MTTTQAAGSPSSQGLLAPLNTWLNNPEVSEIVLNRPQEIFVEVNGQFTRYEVPLFNELTLIHLFQLIAHENEQIFNSEHPLLSASLLDGSRIQLVLPPTAKYPTLAIRRQSVASLQLRDYQIANVYQHTKPFYLQESQEITRIREQPLWQAYQHGRWHDFIQLAILAKKNIVISGGTSSGKTTFLNACLQHIPLQDRLIILEDTCEIACPHPNQVQLLASKGEQGLAAVSMQDLVQCSLRLRPDRIIVGEVRDKEILDFISACATGHSGSITSIHANNPRIALMRMAQLYKRNNVPAMTEKDIQSELQEVVDVIVQLHQESGKRQVHSIYYKDAQKNT